MDIKKKKLLICKTLMIFYTKIALWLLKMKKIKEKYECLLGGKITWMDIELKDGR